MFFQSYFIENLVNVFSYIFQVAFSSCLHFLQVVDDVRTFRLVLSLHDTGKWSLVVYDFIVIRMMTALTPLVINVCNNYLFIFSYGVLSLNRF